MERIPKKECLFVLMDANARTGEKVEERKWRMLGYSVHMDVMS